MFNIRMVVILFIVVPLHAQDMHSWYTQRKTTQAYQENDFATAHNIYSQIVKENPQDPLVNFNEGILLYKQGDYEQAAASFERAATHSHLLTHEQQQQAYFNLGNAKAYQKEWQQALDAYDKVLEQNPEHERARHNKEIVRKLLEQEKQQQKQQEKQKEKNKEQQKEKEQNKDQEEQNQQESDDQQKQDSPKEKQGAGNKPEQRGDQQKGQEQQTKNKGNDSQETADKHDQQGSDQMNKDKETQQQKAQEQEHTSPSSSKNKSQDKTSSTPEQVQQQQMNEQQDEMAQLLERVDQKDTEQAKRLMQVMLAQPKGGQYENRPSW